MRSKFHENRAHVASLRIRDALDAAGAKVGLVLGTGWGDVLDLKEPRDLPFGQLPGFEKLRSLEGHARRVVCGELGGRKVVALRGRVHLNEEPYNPALAEMVRLQVEMLLQLGVDRLILTCAAGSLSPDLRVGDICVVDGLVTVFAPDMPLYGDEFCSPEDALDRELAGLAVAQARLVEPDLEAVLGGHVMVRGPFFEGRRYDKRLLAAAGAKVVGMSVLPECCVAALYPGVKAVALAFVTNSEAEEHSHETNLERSRRSAQALGAYLTRIVAGLGG